MADATFADLFSSDLLLHHDASDAASLWTDTAATSQASNGNMVKAWTRQSDASLSLAYTEATNGPTYRSNYSATGYPGLEFNGTNQLLRTLGTGLSSGQVLYCLCVSTFISGSTVWTRGGGIGFIRQFSSNGMQSSTGTQLSGSSSTARLVCASVARSGHSAMDSLTYCQSTSINNLAANLGTPIALGAYEGSPNSFSQFGSVVIHEILWIAGTCEWGQVIRGSKILRNKWGISDPSALPQKPASASKPQHPMYQQVIG